uniref:Transglutaminase C-terminal domain-containing protein n=1 Tax=Knipowitschia caucasica TaxID=637954 RepID=A0AAV2KRD8_KNICA
MEMEVRAGTTEAGAIVTMEMEGSKALAITTTVLFNPALGFSVTSHLGRDVGVKELVQVEARSYMKHLVEQANLNFIVTGKVKETGQIVTAMKVVTLHNPKLTVEVSGVAKVSEDMLATVQFTNPFSFNLEEIYLRMEGPGAMLPRFRFYSLLAPNSSVVWTEKFNPQRAGSTRIIASLDCPALRQVYGEASITVLP